jgi:hypothetical protein
MAYSKSGGWRVYSKGKYQRSGFKNRTFAQQIKYQKMIKVGNSHYARDHPDIKMGKKFRTRSGRYGCYVYHKGKRVTFIEA